MTVVDEALERVERNLEQPTVVSHADGLTLAAEVRRLSMLLVNARVVCPCCAAEVCESDEYKCIYCQWDPGADG